MYNFNLNRKKEYTPMKTKATRRRMISCFAQIINEYVLGLLSFITVPVDGGSVVMISIGGIKKKESIPLWDGSEFSRLFYKNNFFREGRCSGAPPSETCEGL